jgi:hypothetical protein
VTAAKEEISVKVKANNPPLFLFLLLIIPISISAFAQNEITPPGCAQSSEKPMIPCGPTPEEQECINRGLFLNSTTGECIPTPVELLPPTPLEPEDLAAYCESIGEKEKDGGCVPA